MRPAGGDESDVFFGGPPLPEPASGGISAPTDEVTWGLREIFYGIMLALAALVVSAALIVFPVEAKYGSNTPETDAANAVSQIVLDLLAVAGVFFIVTHKGSTLRALGIRKPQRPGDRGTAAEEGYPWGYHAGMIAVGLIMAYACLFIYLGIISALGLHFLEPSKQIPDNYLENNVVTLILGVGVVAVAPVCEELFFRGFIFGALRRLWGFAIGAIVSGFVFSTAHAQPGLIIPFAGIGFVFAFLYDRSRSIFVSMSVHACFNFISFSLLVAQARGDSDATATDVPQAIGAAATVLLRHLGI
ncbi:MAG TPA: CPBP family intramembrane glutamic endopeptidase [Dehalococcoidia bacterium]